MNANSIVLQGVGANIRKYREARLIKQEYLAKKAGICKSCLSRIENGKRDTTVSKLVELAKILDVEPGLLLA